MTWEQPPRRALRRSLCDKSSWFVSTSETIGVQLAMPYGRIHLFFPALAY
jgi:hypothetical protein